MSSIYKVLLKKNVAKFVKKQDAKRRLQIKKVIDGLSENPYNTKNVKPLIGFGSEVYRIRFGDFRLLYQVEHDYLIVLIIKIGPRGDVYKLN